MKNLFIAEWQKIVGNKWVTGFLIWVFPIGALAFYLVIGVLLWLIPSFREAMAEGSPSSWTGAALGAWSVPTNLFGRMLLVGFIATIFAGEYQWGTWKNVIPRTLRTKLLLAKFLALTAVILLAFTLMALFFGLGNMLNAKIVGQAITPAFSGQVLAEFFGDFLTQGGISFLTIVITIGIVGIAGMKMQSILGAVMVGIGISIVDPLLFGGLIALSQLFKAPAIVHMGRYVPFYNIDNASAWILYDRPSQFALSSDVFGAEYAFTDSLAFSLTVLAVWVVFLTTLIIYLFNRQDINS